MTFGYDFFIYDVNDVMLGSIIERPLKFSDTFEVHIEGKPTVVIKKKFSFFSEKYEIIFIDKIYNVSGDAFRINYTIDFLSENIARVSKKIFSIGDCYEICILNEDEDTELIYISMVIALHTVKYKRSRAFDSSEKERRRMDNINRKY